MKKFTVLIFTFILFSLILNSMSISQSINERLENFGKGFAKGYMQPLINGFGANLNSGLYHSADVSTGIDVYVGVKTMFAFVPSGSKKFDADLSDFGISQKTNTATVVGDKGTSVYDTLKLPDGLDITATPLFVPHISIGNLFGNRVILRFSPAYKLGDYGEFSFLGLGVQHDITQWLIGIPFDWSAHLMYQNMKVKPLIEATAFSIGSQISKTLLFATFYGGLAYETANMNISYNRTPPIPSVNFDLEAENTLRFTVGFGLKFFVFHFNAEYSVAKQPVAVVGLGIAI